jgi:hypothetical protein
MSNQFETIEARNDNKATDNGNLSNHAISLLKDAPQTVAPAASAAVVPHFDAGSIYPDPNLTPGVALDGVTAADVCRPGYAKSVRNVPASEKAEVFREYGITNEPGKYEVDHLISLELGGSNDIANLWPEAYDPRPGAHEKDAVENYLHKQVCDGSMSLKEAQDAISKNWYDVYQQMQK